MIFTSSKNPSTSAGFEPVNIGSHGEHVTPRPPRPTEKMELSVQCLSIVSCRRKSLCRLKAMNFPLNISICFSTLCRYYSVIQVFACFHNVIEILKKLYLIVVYFMKSNYVRMSLTCSQQIDLSCTINLATNNLNSILQASLSISASPANRKTAISKYCFFQVNLIVLEE